MDRGRGAPPVRIDGGGGGTERGGAGAASVASADCSGLAFAAGGFAAEAAGPRDALGRGGAETRASPPTVCLASCSLMAEKPSYQDRHGLGTAISIPLDF